jgi:transcriptional regulator with XRE-family HTH domain
MIDLAALGRRLQAERKRLGLTQSDLASFTGLSRAAVAGYEAGRTAPDVVFIDRLRSAGIRTGFVVDGDRNDQAAPPAFDWELARQLMSRVVGYAQAQSVELEPSQLIDIVQVLYAGAMQDREVDISTIAAAVRLAA